VGDVENGPVELGKENMSTDENPAGKLLSIQGASPRLSPRVGMSKRDEQRHGSLRARLGLDSLHASFLRNSKISPVRRRRMTAEQVSQIKMQMQTSQVRVKSVLPMPILLIIKEIR